MPVVASPHPAERRRLWDVVESRSVDVPVDGRSVRVVVSTEVIRLACPTVPARTNPA